MFWQDKNIIFVSSEKCPLLRPFLKMAGLDDENLSNYHPVSILASPSLQS